MNHKIFTTLLMHVALRMDREQYPQLNYGDGFQLRTMWLFQSLYTEVNTPRFQGPNSTKQVKIEDLHGIDVVNRTPPILANGCLLHMFNVMIGKNIILSPHQACQIAAKFNNKSDLREILGFCRSGTADITLNSVLVVIEEKSNYVGYGIVPIMCYTEETLGGHNIKAHERFSEKLYKLTDGANKIACITIEKSNTCHESGPFYKEIIKVDGNEDQEDMVGNLHGYCLVLATPVTEAKKALYLIFDDSKGPGVKMDGAWLSNIVYMLLCVWKARCWSYNPKDEIVKDHTYIQQMKLQGYDTSNMKKKPNIKKSVRKAQFDPQDLWCEISMNDHKTKAKCLEVLRLTAIEDEIDGDARMEKLVKQANGIYKTWFNAFPEGTGPMKLLEKFIELYTKILPWVLTEEDREPFKAEWQNLDWHMETRIDQTGAKTTHPRPYDRDSWINPRVTPTQGEIDQCRSEMENLPQEEADWGAPNPTDNVLGVKRPRQIPVDKSDIYKQEMNRLIEENEATGKKAQKLIPAKNKSKDAYCIRVDSNRTSHSEQNQNTGKQDVDMATGQDNKFVKLMRNPTLNSPTQRRKVSKRTRIVQDSDMDMETPTPNFASDATMDYQDLMQYAAVGENQRDE